MSHRQSILTNIKSGCCIMAITAGFQPADRGSIPRIRTTSLKLRSAGTIYITFVVPLNT